MVTSTVEPELRRARAAVFLAFFLNGFVIALWVVNVPAVAGATGLGNAALGTTLLALGAGSVIAMQAAGYLSAAVGSRSVVIVGAILLGAGLVLIASASDWLGLAVALLVLGSGNGAIDVAMNDQAVQVQRRYGRPIMSAFHALFSVGGACGAATGAVLLAVGAVPRVGLVASAAAVVVAGVIAGLGLLSRQRSGPTAGTDRTAPRAPAPHGLLGQAVVLGALAFVFMLAEGMVNDWSALHATQHLGRTPAAASLAYLFFAITMTVGRLLVDRVVASVGPARVVRVGSVTAALGLAVVVLSPVYPVTIAGWMLFGIGLAGIVPQIFSAAGELGGEGTRAIVLSRIVSAGYVGMLAGPAAVGWLSAGVGINLALLLPLALITFGIAAAPVVAARRDAGGHGSPQQAASPATSDVR